MDASSLIPTPNMLPAPWWLFEALSLLTLTVHFLLISTVVGSVVILIVQRFTNSALGSIVDPLKKIIPSIFALSVTFGVAPLLFLQVSYGHLFYSSSVLMAKAWMMIIPLLILGYYGLYIHVRGSKKWLRTLAIIISGLFILYIAKMFVANMTLMVAPEKWVAYFDHRDGSFIDLSDPTFIPRFLHFFFASLAISSIVASVLYHFKNPEQNDMVKKGLQWFGHFTVIQVLVGFWWIMALPREIMLQFMGDSTIRTVMFVLAMLISASMLFTAYRGKLMVTFYHLIGMVVIMVFTRSLLRFSYIEDFFSYDQFVLNGQYGVLALFLVVFALGILSIIWMVKAVRRANS